MCLVHFNLGGSEVKTSACICLQCGTPGFDPWLGKIPWRRKQQRMRCMDDVIDSMEVSLNKLWDFVKDRKACHAAIHEATKSGTWLSE